MVPVRGLAEALGFEVEWIDPNKISIRQAGLSIGMFVNERQYTVNGNKKILDIPPVVKGSRVVVPLRFIAEELGCRVQYNDLTGTVNIYTE